MTVSNVIDQIGEAKQRNRELQLEFEKWRSGTIKLSCNCDSVDAREKYPTIFIAECRDLSERFVREVDQLKNPLLSAYNFYRVQSARRREAKAELFSGMEAIVGSGGESLDEKVQSMGFEF
ncbi:Protein CBG14342 [Caenorhabditis briggsae]|uniref:Protein CBG14342 n=1 Tax=Caenorhabditis briggsae TaxID=6238 RepID=A8XJS8_CAEBR|nr:Protein CBG14342 [Caenorhabditis briggsae]CAP32904.2 Protein CBG14342 [Caenorhabditis briggsae]